MTASEELVILIAEAAAPDEVDLAPELLDAYLEGGEAREELFLQVETSVAGGFGPGSLTTVLPWIFRGIITGGKFLVTVLTSDESGEVLENVKTAIEISKAVSPEKKAEITMPEGDPYDSLNLFIQAMSEELRHAGFTDEGADLVTFRVVSTLLSERASALSFVKELREHNHQ